MVVVRSALAACVESNHARKTPTRLTSRSRAKVCHPHRLEPPSGYSPRQFIDFSCPLVYYSNLSNEHGRILSEARFQMDSKRALSSLQCLFAHTQIKLVIENAGRHPQGECKPLRLAMRARASPCLRMTRIRSLDGQLRRRLSLKPRSDGNYDELLSNQSIVQHFPPHG